MADHKAICLDINIEEFKPWGNFYWKLNSSISNENGYIKLIEDLFKEFELRRKKVDILENWEIFKNEVKEVSTRFSNAKVKQRRTQIQINREMKEYYENWEISDRIDKIDNEIGNFRNKGNLIRSRYEDLNQFFEGKEISRKMEIKKGHTKLIIHNFYQDLYSLQNIQDQKINDYLIDFYPPKLDNEEKVDLKKFISGLEILRAIAEQKNSKYPGLDEIPSEFYKKNYKMAQISTEISNNIYIYIYIYIYI